MEIKEYKCPNCGGAVKFDSSSQKMKCPFCDTEFEMDAIEEYQKEVAAPKSDNFKWDESKAGGNWSGAELDDLSMGSCPSCGAELLGDKNTAAMVCPNCGNTQIVIRRLSGMLKPNYVIPFKLEKTIAFDSLKKFYQKKKLLPDFFTKDNHISEVQGVYLPYWLFDAKANAHITYKAVRTKAWSDPNYNYMKTDHYSVVRDGSIGFEKIPVDGSEKMDDAFMDSIEPFDYSQIKNFETAFLSGYIAEKYDVKAGNCKVKAGNRIKNTIESEFYKSVTGYSSIIKESSTVNIQDGKINYAMFPVWVLNTKYKKENYQFLMNGQTGVFAGRLPIDNGKAWKYRLLYMGIIGAILTVIIQALRIFT